MQKLQMDLTEARHELKPTKTNCKHESNKDKL